MLTGALLGIVEDAAHAILTLTDGVDDATLFSLHLTRDEAIRRLIVIADSLGNLPADAAAALSSLDRDGWAMTARGLHSIQRATVDEALAFGVRSLVPALILNLRRYRRSHPELFVFKP